MPILWFFLFAHFLSTDKNNIDLVPIYRPGPRTAGTWVLLTNQVPVYPLQERTQFFFFTGPGARTKYNTSTSRLPSAKNALARLQKALVRREKAPA
jgi:hypothetical protein